MAEPVRWLSLDRDRTPAARERGGDGTRSAANWLNNAGWFGHAEVPENDHWDPGALKWAELFQLAAPNQKQQQEEQQMTEAFKTWVEWVLVWKRDPDKKPKLAFTPTEKDWADADWIHGLIARYGAHPRYQAWRDYWLAGSPKPDNAPSPIPPRWWDAATVDHKFANAYAAKADDPLEAQVAAHKAKIASLQAELADVRRQLDEAKKSGGAEVAAFREREKRVRVALEQALAVLA